MASYSSNSHIKLNSAAKSTDIFSENDFFSEEQRLESGKNLVSSQKEGKAAPRTEVYPPKHEDQLADAAFTIHSPGIQNILVPGSTPAA